MARRNVYIKAHLSEAPNRSRAAGHLMTPCSTEVAVLMWFVPAAAELRGITIKMNQARTTNEPDKNLLNELESKNKIIEAKDQTIKNLVHEVGFLIQEHRVQSHKGTKPAMKKVLL